MRIAGPDIAVMAAYVGIEKLAQSAGMLMDAYLCCDLPVAAATAVAGDGHIDTGLSQFRGVIPFRDNEPRHAVFAEDSISS
jgi:hypothetical protein